MALAAAYGRPPEPRYEQPAPQYQDPGPYRAQEPLPSQLARPAKKKRPRRKHGELARGIVRRREDWDDHCLIEMDDGFEDVFCHRHRCQGKQLPEQGQVVDFKLHLSSKSLCWQSGFVTWEEGDMAELKRPEPPLDIPRAPPRVPEPRTWAPPPQQRQPYGGYYDQRPRASSFDDRRARLPSDLSDGVTESSYASDTPWGYQQQRPSPAEFADRGAASLLATLDAPAWTPQQRARPSRPDTELASDLRQLGFADPPRPPPRQPDPSPPWLAGMLDEPAPSLGAFDRPAATQPPPPPGLADAEPTWASAATRPAGAPPLPRPRASSVSSSVASDGASALDRIALKVVPVDEQKTPWLATADLPARRAAPIEQLQKHTQSAVEAGNASAIQKLKRRRETRKRAKRGDHCRVEVRPRDGGGVFVSAYGVNAAGAGAALRRMLTANAALLAGRDVDATADDTPETRQNLGWAELVAQLRSILARGESRGICCNHLSRAFERDFGSALVETLFGNYESLAALLRAPQLKDVVTLVEQPGRPDLMVRLAQTETPERAQPAVREALRSLGLERYEATFAREDVSVQTLVRMTDDDLAALGLPKGPRVQILAWASR